jgi:murein L,D-transpeptidase YafK
MIHDKRWLTVCGLLFLLACATRIHRGNATTGVRVSGTDAAPSGEEADRIVIEKRARTMTLLSDGKALKTYKVALGGQPVGAKEQEGDHKTPEGIYKISAKVPNSMFHRGLLISYPNAADIQRAEKRGVKPGGAVEIHGLGAKYGWVGAAHRATDWTDGCVAVTNQEIDEIWPLVDVGTVVEIRP